MASKTVIRPIFYTPILVDKNGRYESHCREDNCIMLDVWNVEDSFLRGTGGRSWGEVLRGGLDG